MKKAATYNQKFVNELSHSEYHLENNAKGIIRKIMQK